VAKPVPHKFEPFALNAVYALATSLFLCQQTGSLKDSKVTRSRLPSVLKNGRNFARRHRATMEINGKEHAASRGMR
jgi:hypothetical protein